ncbi:MAG: flagellar biosynthetic protein FliO [Gammaproteobacteria bacterium]
MSARSVRRTGALAVCGLLCAQAARAAEDGAAKAPALVEPLAGAGLIQVGLGLFAVLLMIVGVAWLMRRLGGLPGTQGGALRVLGGLSMGARERVVLIQVGETQLLLGVAPGRVQTLHVLGQPLPAQGPSEPLAGGFAANLSAALRRGDKP